MSRHNSERLRAALDDQLADLGAPPYEGPDGRVPDACLGAVLRAYEAGVKPHRPVEKAAVRLLLDRLVKKAPGKSVEIRVPPHAAVQCVEGLRHTRGTPPNLVETDARTWIALATGEKTWAEAVAEGKVLASGSRADLAAFLPLR